MVETAREGHWFGKKLQEIGEYSQDRAEYAVWNRAGNSLEYGREKTPPLSGQRFMLFKDHYKSK